MTKLKIGIVGTGAITGKHADAIAEIENAELVALCSSSSERAQAAKEKFGIDTYSDISAFLTHPELDIVCICTASGHHMEAGLLAAKAGKHLLIEKPIEINLGRADQLIEACEKYGVRLGVIFQNRFSADYLKLKAAVQEGRFGKLLMGNAHVNWYRAPEYYSGSPWKGTLEGDGGGAFMNQGIHTVDLLLDIMGDVKSVFAKVKTALHPIEGEDLGTALVTFENKALGNITASTALYPGLPERLEIFGKCGSAVLEAGKIVQWSILGEEPEPIIADSNTGSGAADPMAIGHGLHRAQWEHYLKAVENNEPLLVEGNMARKSVELIRAIYKSSELEKEVELPFVDYT
ncbi:putative dehydrogenase [Algoriphagus ratkowskyi]|uniref:Gfo/Idh/MocA family oxidoreductase n=1 Tax=Algoriphagus ratkowskyi TaxID=57028 RepID=A0A2W7S2Y8_9BACT|nr:Gfo/Idh/MocA family oxidoreductase [Algoriphagus ratkowskyi]PZX61319.1 putative dehydrogenase [Algoriphagus ratkowskyi]TXD79425.1 Gfo/Idh/MocA family oxidoreductase [Algoriphagus ratkowskyi]